MKVERFYCLKCSSLVELVYLDHIIPAAKIIFDEIKEAGLCYICANKKEDKEQFLH